MFFHSSKKNIAISIVIIFVVGIFGGILGSAGYRHFSEPAIFLPDKTEPAEDPYTAQSEQEKRVIAIVEKANPAVVSIQIQKQVSDTQPHSQLFPFEDFFGQDFPFELNIPEEESAPGELRRVGGGSGFIIEPDGLIVTNRHVVADEKAVYTVVLSDGTTYDAQVLAKDPVFDIALIKINASGLPTLRIGNSEGIKIGQTTIAIGYALAEFGNTVTLGVVSGIGRRVQTGDGLGFNEIIEEAIQTDAAINPGNSGGPLLNLAGEVIGINTAVSREGQLVGFAIPINSVKKTIESVQQHGRIIRPWLGVRHIPVTPRLAQENNLPVTYGVLITRGQNADQLAVIPGSPADKAGIEERDILLQINGRKLEDKTSLAKEISRHSVGDTITITLLRNGKEKVVTTVLAEFPLEN